MIFNYKYGGNTAIQNSSTKTGMSFAPDTYREPTYFVGALNKHIPFREAISTLHHVVVSDLRFKPKDKTAYKEWAAQQEEIWLAEYMAEQPDVKAKIEEVKKELQDVRKQKQTIMGPYNKAKADYFSFIYKRDRDAWFVLDPVITVHPDELFFECFSQDESTYGKLSCSYNVFKHINEFECGTTNIDYSAKLYNEFQKIRDYKETEFKVDPTGFTVKTTNEDDYKEVKIDLPDSWVRGFLQVSSAMSIPATRLDLHPMDVWNFCFILRRNRAKTSPRSMRYILIPGEPIRVIFEPWNREVVCKRSIYQGKTEQEIRVWGRRRLLILERLLPIAQNFTVYLLGTGLPSFYIADLGDMDFTLGLSGWTANDWSKAGNFDLMAPRAEVDSFTKKMVFDALKENWQEAPADLAARLGLKKETVLGALAAYTQAGSAIYDLNKNVYRVRELSHEPLPLEKLRFANDREARAYQLVTEEKAFDIQAKVVPDKGLALSGHVFDEKNQERTYHVNLLIDRDQRMMEGTCSCNFYQQNKLYKGPCEHLLAVRIANNKRK